MEGEDTLNRQFANDLLMNLLERAQTSGEKTFLTSMELQALAIILEKKSPESVSSKSGDVRAARADSSVVVDTIAAQLLLQSVGESEIPKNALLCVDFGTSFSKAFASVDNGTERPELIDLPIGGGSGLTRLVT